MTKTLKRTLVFMSLAVVLVFSNQRCYYDNAEDLYPQVEDTTGTDTLAPSFASDVKPIIDTRCALPGCHVSGSVRQPLTTYDEVKTAIESWQLEQRVVIDKTMPQGSSLTASQISLIDRWIDDGYQNN